MSREYSEDGLVQKTTIDYFKYNLDWNTAFAFNTEVLGINGTFGRRSEKEVVLVKYLKPALRELNPNLPEQAYDNAIEKIIENNISKSLIDMNKEKYMMFREGVRVEFKDKEGNVQEEKLQIFNFKEPLKNHFLAVRELWIQGNLYRRRADIVGFVNGIPLLFIELKNVHKDIKSAYENNLSDYKDTITEIFNFNAFVILSNGSEGKVGAVTSKYDYFGEWKRLEEEDEGSVDFETMLKGICSKLNFMDIFENFITFDDSSGKIVKIIARNHQFLGVNRAVESFKDAKANKSNKLGVFWHTQGSGKSYSIVFFCQKILRKIPGNHSFLIVTDRKELDEQIYKTFIGTEAIKANHNIWAVSGEHLKKLLKENNRYVFTLIHKFNEKVLEPFPNSEDVIVISDEAHRTQYGLLATNMRNALPDAKFLGFTGTPLLNGDELTKEYFGDYISIYDFDRAVKDGATVPLYYESRGEKLGIVDAELNSKIQDKIDEFDLSDDQEEKLRRALSKEYHVLTSNERLEKIAKDIVNHYSIMWESGKAMLVCLDKVTCLRMYNLIDKYWKEKIIAEEQSLKNCFDEQDEAEKRKHLNWLKETEYAVVVSEEQNEVSTFEKWGLDIIPHREKIKKGIKRNGEDKYRDLATDYKDPESPFRIVIVCAMWLTGFDVKSLSIMYLDKVLKEHTLMQTIARANRVYEGKNNGLIVDYIGILKNLREALSKYGKGGGEQGGKTPGTPAKTDDELISELSDVIKQTKTHLKSLNFNLNDLVKCENGFAKIKLINDAKEVIYVSKDTKKKFELLAREVISKYKACLYHEDINKYTPPKNAIEIIYKKIQEVKLVDDITEVIRELHLVVDEAINTQEIGEDSLAEYKKFDISHIDFDRLKEEFKKNPRKNTTVHDMQEQIEKRLEKMLKQNPTRIDYYERYQKIIEEYNSEKDRVTIERTFEDLLNFVNDLSKEEKRAAREGLTEEYLVILDLLEKPNLSTRERETLKRVSKELLDELKKIISSIDNWVEKQQSQSKVKTVIYDFLFENLPESYEEYEIEEKREIIFSHVLFNYKNLTQNAYAS
ncbi:type I restriction endonuclease subunit R [Heyndrickxia sporothermodurans]